MHWHAGAYGASGGFYDAYGGPMPTPMVDGRGGVGSGSTNLSILTIEVRSRLQNRVFSKKCLFTVPENGTFLKKPRFWR